MIFSTADDLVDGHPVLRLHGEIDVSEVPRLADAVDALLAGGEKGAILDVSGVTFLDSSGLRALEEARARADERGVRMEIVCPPGKVLRLMELTGVDGRLAVRRDLDSALAAFRD